MVDDTKTGQDTGLSDGERPTLKTIARLSGLAVPTVSRALSDAPDIGVKTKEKVRKIARDIGYRRNRAGLRLRTGKTNVIALVLGANKDVMNHTAQLIGSIALELRETAYHLVVIPYFDDQALLDPVRYIVETGSADGVILNRIQPEDERVAYLKEHNLPFVTHGRTLDCHTHAYFDFDNSEFGRAAIRKLVERGRKRILLVAPQLDQSYAHHTIAGARDAAKEAGIDVILLEDGTSDMDSNEVAATVGRALENDSGLDGLIASSPSAAIGATMAAEIAGYSLGEDFDLVAKEAIPFLSAFRKEMLVVHEDVSEAGSFIARALIQAIAEPGAKPMQKLTGLNS
ncbi:MAG: LacI family DNA-binding transcriptional regulator [Boseongicola sp.]|nr:MAG: LacI family DNA-binding transcriptional regulator [Boseongicola sp.]